MCEVINLLESNALELEYVSECARLMSSQIQGDFKLVIKHHWQPLPPPENKWVGVINLSDESHGVPVEVLRPDVAVIFQPYYILDRWDLPFHNPKIRPFPLGLTNGFQAQPLPIKDRTYDACFSGNISDTGSRNMFKTHIDNVCDLGKYNISMNYTDGFHSGMPKDKYAQMLGESKIAFCPAGAISRETFRFYEALASGCVIIGDTLPKLWFYEPLVFFPVKWHSVEKTIEFVLSLGDEEMQKISDRNLKLCEDMLSPQPISNYMVNEINKIMDCVEQKKTLDIDPTIISMAQAKVNNIGGSVVSK